MVAVELQLCGAPLFLCFHCKPDGVQLASPFLGRPRSLSGKTAATQACSRLYRLLQFFLCSFSSPKCSAISRRIFLALRIAMISGSNAFMFVHFLLLIATPPDVVLFSYIRGCFVYVRFYWTCSRLKHSEGFLIYVQAFQCLRHGYGGCQAGL